MPTHEIEPSLTLYELEGCPWCELVIETLDELDLPYESVFVEALHSERDEVKRVSGSRTVPVLVDASTGVTMSESANIIEYLETMYGS